MKPLKQQCFIWSVWLTWIGLPLLAVVMGLIQGWWAGVLVLLMGAAGQMYYLKVFPRMSRSLGYGSVEDVTVAPGVQQRTSSHVTLYTANVCPFCPIIKRRLLDLQQTLGFELEEVDITFHPGIAKEKGFLSVPVVEVDGRHWFGNATSAELSSFLKKS